MDVAVADRCHRAQREVERVRARVQVRDLARADELEQEEREGERHHEQHDEHRQRRRAPARLAAAQVAELGDHRPSDQDQPGEREHEVEDDEPRSAVEVDRERVVGDQHAHERQDRARPPVALPHHGNRFSARPLDPGSCPRRERPTTSTDVTGRPALGATSTAVASAQSGARPGPWPWPARTPPG